MQVKFLADSSSGLGFLVLSQGTLVRIQYPSLAIIEYTPVPASIGYILIAFPQRVDNRNLSSLLRFASSMGLSLQDFKNESEIYGGFV